MFQNYGRWDFHGNAGGDKSRALVTLSMCNVIDTFYEVKSIEPSNLMRKGS